MIIKTAMDWAVRNNISPNVIAQVYTEPEYTYSDPVHIKNERRIRGELCLIVDQNGVILSVLPAEQAELVVDEVPDISIPKARGGKAGNVYPTSYDEVVAMLKQLGYSVEYSGGGHISVYEKDDHSCLIYVLPNSASDYRTLRNSIAGLKKVGIDLRRSA